MTMRPLPEWTKTSIAPETLEAPLARAAGWIFFEHPTEGDEFPVLAVSLDYMDENGPIVYNTNDFDVPQYL